jgi:hypothetical protein
MKRRSALRDDTSTNTSNKTFAQNTVQKLSEFAGRVIPNF